MRLERHCAHRSLRHVRGAPPKPDTSTTASRWFETHRQDRAADTCPATVSLPDMGSAPSICAWRFYPPVRLTDAHQRGKRTSVKKPLETMSSAAGSVG
jgi:hypothetical protein